MWWLAVPIHRLIQEEKQSTEARAEELESRVGSLEHMNLLTRGRSSDRQSPPMSGRSTPNSPNRDYLHKYHTVSVTNSMFIPTVTCTNNTKLETETTNFIKTHRKIRKRKKVFAVFSLSRHSLMWIHAKFPLETDFKQKDTKKNSFYLCVNETFLNDIETGASIDVSCPPAALRVVWSAFRIFAL